MTALAITRGSYLANYKAWCERHGFEPMPATPEVVGAYLAAAGEGYALPTLRRRVAAIARACGVAGHPLDTRHPAIRETLRGIARKHGAPARRAAALTTAEVKWPGTGDLPVTALRDWLAAAEIGAGPLFRKVNRGG